MTSRPILSTKLYTPQPRPNAIPRPHLVAELEAGLYRKLSLICAPAGSGKTTLVSAWLRDHPAAAWLSLDADENDPARFFAYLLAALDCVDPAMTTTARELLAGARLPPPGLLADTLTHNITADPGPPFVLALDDYHVITAPAVHETLEALLDRGAPRMHLVILTRQDPPLPLARLRARDQLTELRQRDLRFSTAEVLTFLNHSMQLQLSEEEATALNERTEGWVAGLQMAALSLRGRAPDEASAFVERFSGRHHHILDYLTDEVLGRQTAQVQDFMLRTAILDRLCAPLCALLLESPAAGSAQAMLDYLEEANLFLVPLDDERRWYRYHHLFADLLRARLGVSNPALACDLHRRAAAWLEKNELEVDAVNHALASGDWSLAGDMIERVADSLASLAKMNVGLLLHWLQALPADLLRERPRLRMFLSRARYLSGEQEAGLRMLSELEEELSAGADFPGRDSLRASVAGDRASFAVVRGEVRQAAAFARQALAHVDDRRSFSRIRPLSILAMAHYRAGEVAPAFLAFTEAIALAQKAKAVQVMVPLVCNLAEIHLMRGQLDHARQTCRQALDLGTIDGKPTATAGYALLEMGKIHYQRDELPAAEEALRQGAALLRAGGIAEEFGTIHATLALVLQALEDREGSDWAIKQALEATDRGDIPRLTALVHAHQARLWLARALAEPADQADQLALVGNWADEYRQMGETEYLREFEELTLARALLARVEAPAARAALDRLIPPAEEHGRTGAVIEALAIRALAAAAAGDTQAALADLERSLALGWHRGYRRLYLDEGRPMAELLRHAASRGIQPRPASALLAMFDLPDEAPRPQPLIEPLTGRELEVLALLAAGLTNPEIARRLVVSLPTVKSHTRAIYGKLGVHDRRAAVDRARALGMLPT